MLEILLIAVALAMDCFTVSVVCGVLLQKFEVRTVFRIAFLFGLFQALMPLVGWFLTSRFSTYIEAYDHWIAFGLLLFLGGKMIADAFRKEGNPPAFDPRRLRTQVVFAVATSIDALAIGITFAVTGYTTLGSLTGPLVTIGVVSFLFSLLGSALGIRFGDAFTRRFKPELVGGLILVAIGIKILIEHLAS